MSDSEKIDKIYDFVIKHETEIALLKACQESQAVCIVDFTTITDGYVADRNKLVGVAWLGGALGGMASYGANRMMDTRTFSSAMDKIGISKFGNSAREATRFAGGGHLSAMGIGAGIGSYATLKSNRGY